MTKPSLDLAPGCFGMGMVYQPGTQVCDTCQFAAECGPLSATRIEEVRVQLGIKPIAKPAPKPASPIEAMLPKKVSALVAQIQGAGLMVAKNLHEGRNPFSDRPRFLKITCHLLLRNPLGVHRNLLKYAFQKTLDHAEQTASAHVLQAVQTLGALGATREDDHVLRIL
jgi:hypothetical protein